MLVGAENKVCTSHSTVEYKGVKKRLLVSFWWLFSCSVQTQGVHLGCADVLIKNGASINKQVRSS